MSVEILFAGPIAADRLRVEWSDPPPISDCARGRIDHQWGIYMEEARAKGVSLFNGKTVALNHFRADPGGLSLQLFPGDYKSFMVTCVRDFAWFEKNAPESVSPALGNSALLTFGQSAYLGVRGKTAALNPGLAHVFGGVPEYENKPMKTADIISHLARELGEEAHLSAADLADQPTLLGLFYEPILHQPELVWQWELRAPLTLVDQLEHDAIRVIARHDKNETGFTPLAAAVIEHWRKE